MKTYKFILVIFFFSFLSCQKDEPYIPQDISKDCEQDMEYSIPITVGLTSPYGSRSYYEGDTIHIKAFSTTWTQLVSSECYITSLTDNTFLDGLILRDYLTFDYVVDDRIDSVLIEIGGIQLNGYKDGTCGIQQLWRSTRIKVKLNH